MTKADPISIQDKGQEIAFFDGHATQASEYNVFAPTTNRYFIDCFMRATGVQTKDRVLDLGCGSGVFSHLLSERGLNVTGLDISPKLVALGRQLYPKVEFVVGDAEKLTFPNGQFQAVFLGGVIHHFPQPQAMAHEVARVTAPGGSFWAFDPNRRNPFMYLYRVKSSPLYSSKGVTPNEQPVCEEDVVRTFGESGFDVQTDFTSVRFTYVASSLTRFLLPMYNLIETICFAPGFLKHRRAFLLTWGKKAG